MVNDRAAILGVGEGVGEGRWEEWRVCVPHTCSLASALPSGWGCVGLHRWASSLCLHVVLFDDLQHGIQLRRIVALDGPGPEVE